MFRSIIFSIIAIILFVGCTDDSQDIVKPTPIRDLSPVEKQLAQNANTFGFNLYKGLVNETPDSNIFISPLSVSLALGMTLNGAVGETREEMEAVLTHSGLTQEQINENYKTLMQYLTTVDPAVMMEIANSIWYRQEFPVKQDFISANQQYFDAEVVPANFGDPATVGLINGWVDEKTHGKIEKLLDEIEDSMFMFLIDAIYFKGTWTYIFDPKETISAPFHLSNGSEVMCNLMVQERVEVSFALNDAYTAVALPYGNKAYQMVLIVPTDGAVNDLIQNLDDDVWNSILASLRKAEISLYIPKFELEYAVKLNDVLIGLGMHKAFDKVEADLSGISDFLDLYIDHVLHKSYVKVNEEGTEAAAVTSVGIGFTSGPWMFRADRPFVYAIHESNSNSIVFIGKVETTLPSSGASSQIVTRRRRSG